MNACLLYLGIALISFLLGYLLAQVTIYYFEFKKKG